MKYWLKYGKLYRWPSYLYNYLFHHTKFSDGRWFSCCCNEGSNSIYWNGYFKRGKDCECGG